MSGLEFEIDSDVDVIPKTEPDDVDLLDCDNKSGTVEVVNSLYDFGRLPIVYTTRLEEMHIFKQDLKHLSLKEITDHITFESKPKRIKLNNLPYKHEISFNDLEQRIKQINHKFVTTKEDQSTVYIAPIRIKKEKHVEELSDRSKNLLRQCKPLSIVLYDISNQRLSSKVDSLKSKSTTKKIKVKSMFKFEGYGYKSCYFFSKMNIRRDYVLVLYDSGYNETDIYYIDKASRVMDHHQLKGCDDANIKPFIGTKTAFKFECCCWFQRQDVINNLLRNECIKTSVAKYMKNRHKCSLGSCYCCCENAHIGVSTSKSKSVVPTVAYDKVSNKKLVSPNNSSVSEDDLEIQTLENDISNRIIEIRNKIVEPSESGDNKYLFRQLISSSKTDTVINKALRYTRTINNNNKVFAHDPGMKRCQRRLIEITGKRSEYYEIDTKGDIMSYRRISKNDITVAIEKQKNEVLNYSGCCWWSRETFIKGLKNSLGLHNVTKYMKNEPHLCSIGYCKCCCKEKYQLRLETELKVADKPLPFRVQCFSSANQQTTLMEINAIGKPVPDGVFMPQMSSPSIETQYVSTVPPLQPITKSSATTKTTGNAKNPQETDFKVADFEIDHSNSLSTRSSIENAQLVKTKTSLPNNMTVNNTPTDQNKDVDSESKKNNPAPVANTAEEVQVKSLISSILDRFKDVRLMINEDGKVVATLSTPINKLSTSELQVLSAILRHAEQQVKELKLRPGVTLNNNINLVNTINEVTSQSKINHDPSQVDKNVTLPMHFTQNTDVIHDQVPLTTNTTKTAEISTVADKFCSQHGRNINAFESFTNVTNLKRQYYNQSFQSHIKHMSIKTSEISAPKITNTFSLQDKANVVWDDKVSLNNSFLNNVSDKSNIENVFNKSNNSFTQDIINFPEIHKPKNTNYPELRQQSPNNNYLTTQTATTNNRYETLQQPTPFSTTANSIPAVPVMEDITHDHNIELVDTGSQFCPDTVEITVINDPNEASTSQMTPRVHQIIIDSAPNAKTSNETSYETIDPTPCLNESLENDIIKPLKFSMTNQALINNIIHNELPPKPNLPVRKELKFKAKHTLSQKRLMPSKPVHERKRAKVETVKEQGNRGKLDRKQLVIELDDANDNPVNSDSAIIISKVHDDDERSILGM